MDGQGISFRLMRRSDFAAVVAIDEQILGSSRKQYYEEKFEKYFSSNDFVPTSLVAEENGQVVGFVMGEVYIGEYGINQEGATLDSIGVSPGHRKKGIGERLVEEFVAHIKSLGISKINTLVGDDDPQLMRFFKTNGFVQSRTINLERNF